MTDPDDDLLHDRTGDPPRDRAGDPPGNPDDELPYDELPRDDPPGNPDDELLHDELPRDDPPGNPDDELPRNELPRDELPHGPADATWSMDSAHAIDREFERELVRAKLFGGAAPRIGRFAVGERLGAGASSVVYAAWDELLTRRVAVKIFAAESSATRRHVEREARALAQLSHRNVVAVYEVGEWRGHAFIAMELIAGTTLARWQSARRRSVAELIDAYLQAGRGLEAAHRAGLVHRDFKPANVMVGGDGRVAVTDFGLAGSVAPGDGDPAAAPGSASTTRTPIGTPAYVAPEQRRGATPHPSADIYSFALALCEALVGWHPMQRDEPAWRAALARRVPRRIHDAICAGLAPQPAARGDTLRSLLDALRPRPRRGARWIATAALLGLAGLAAAVALFSIRARASAPPPAVPPQFAAPLLQPLVRAIDAFAAAPPGRDDPAAAAELRALLVAPLPTELRCPWPAPLVALALGDDLAIGLDDLGRVHACELDGGAVSLAATGARCIVPGPDRTIGTVDHAGQVRVVRATATGWRAVDGIASDATPMSAIPDMPCPFVLVREPGGAMRATIHRAIATDAAGQRSAVSRDGTVRILDGDGAERSSHVWTDPRITPLIDMSRDGSRAVVAEIHGPLWWWQASTARWQEERLYSKNPSLRRARLSPSGARVLLLDYFGSLEIRTLGGGRGAWLTMDAITAAVFRGDDTVIAIDTDRRLWRWDLYEQRSGVAMVHDRTVWSIAANTEVVASGSEDGTILVADRWSGALRLALRPGFEIYRIALDGDHLIAAGQRGLRIWNWRTGAPVAGTDGGPPSWDVEPAIGAGGARVYVAGALTRGATLTWTEGALTPISQNPFLGTRVSDVAVSPDGQTAASVDSTGRLIVIDIARGRQVFAATAHSGAARQVAFDPATKTIVTIGDDGWLLAWAPPEPAPRWSLQVTTGPLYALDVHDGVAITGAANGSVTRVDLVTGRVEHFRRGHDSAVRVVQFRGDGQWFVTGDNTGRVCLWRSDGDDCHTWLDGHRTGVLAAAFTDDGELFTASEDGTVRYWWPTYDLPVDALRAALSGHGAQR